MVVVLRMPFFNLSNANILFATRQLAIRRYTAAKAMPTIRRAEINDKECRGHAHN